EVSRPTRPPRPLPEGRHPRGPRRAVRVNAFLVKTPASILPGATRAPPRPPVEVEERRVQLLTLGVRPPRDHIGDLATEIDSVPERARSRRACEGGGQRRDEKLAPGGQPLRFHRPTAPA